MSYTFRPNGSGVSSGSSAFSGDYNDLTNKPTIPTVPAVNNTLTSTSATNPLSANQGKVLNDKIVSHTGDTTIHVTAAEKTAWNSKSTFSGSYADLTNKPTIPTLPTINNTLTSTSTTQPLSAAQGKVLNDLITTLTADYNEHKTLMSQEIADLKQAILDLQTPTGE